ncbi:hypothetical protein COX08_03895, partial [Candidatus Beckwithbacteria bacterium CG23_combo_of_CG06-09_8_20_14_all_34_8]
VPWPIEGDTVAALSVPGYRLIDKSCNRTTGDNCFTVPIGSEHKNYRRAVWSGTSVTPGSTYTWTPNINIPTTPGNYTLKLQMAWEDPVPSALNSYAGSYFGTECSASFTVASTAPTCSLSGSPAIGDIYTQDFTFNITAFGGDGPPYTYKWSYDIPFFDGVPGLIAVPPFPEGPVSSDYFTSDNNHITKFNTIGNTTSTTIRAIVKDKNANSSSECSVPITFNNICACWMGYPEINFCITPYQPVGCDSLGEKCICQLPPTGAPVTPTPTPTPTPIITPTPTPTPTPIITPPSCANNLIYGYVLNKFDTSVGLNGVSVLIQNDQTGVSYPDVTRSDSSNNNGYFAKTVSLCDGETFSISIPSQTPFKDSTTNKEYKYPSVTKLSTELVYANQVYPGCIGSTPCNFYAYPRPLSDCKANGLDIVTLTMPGTVNFSNALASPNDLSYSSTLNYGVGVTVPNYTKTPPDAANVVFTNHTYNTAATAPLTVNLKYTVAGVSYSDSSVNNCVINEGSVVMGDVGG